MAPYDPRTGTPFLAGPALGMPPPIGDPDRPFPAGTRIAGRFEVLSCLDEGRCGFLYRVRDRQDADRERVLKTLDPRRSDERDAEAFQREMILLKRLAHPRIPRGLGMVTHAGMACALQEGIPGMDLHARVSREGPLSEAEGRDVLAQGLDILDYLHGLRPRVLHRDVKPDNLVRDPEGRLWLIDFGAATDRPADPRGRSEREWTTLQTLGYAAPEQALGLQSYPASDCFSLAASTLFLVTGHNPIVFFDGQKGRYTLEAPLSEGLRELLEAMLAVPVAERITSAREALERLKRLS